MFQELKIYFWNKGLPFKVAHNVNMKHLTIEEMQWIPALTKVSRLAVSQFLGFTYIID